MRISLIMDQSPQGSQALAFLRKRYPALQYFPHIDGLTPDALHLLAAELHLQPSQMSPSCKETIRLVRQFATAAEAKLKSSRKLYKFLACQEGHLSQIIMNNQQLSSLVALENRSMTELTELQIGSNEVDSLQPLSTLMAPSLQQIDLSSNAITMLRPLNDCHWPSLTTLMLSQNKIASLEPVAFSRFPALKVLFLSDNFLTRVRALRKELSGLRNLRKMDLSSNYINDLHCLSECKFIQLNYLNLQDNLSFNFLQVEKFTMGPDLRRNSVTNYQIRITTDWPRAKIFLYNYRQMSQHRLSVKIEGGCRRVGRETIQKGRKLLLE